MNDYVIYTDSACDIPSKTLAEWNVGFCSLSYIFQGENIQHSSDEMPLGDFYSKMRSGAVAKTSAVNINDFYESFENEIRNGKDILYLGFSSGLSTTYNSAAIAARQLTDKYPYARILTIDTLAASAGFGLIVYLAVKEKNKGKSVDEVAKFVTDIRFKLCHWFTVDDLVYLKRGGRISSAVAIAGTLLGIKPVLHVDNEGHLINMFKVRGRKPSIQALADKYGELVSDKTLPIFISHGDCLDDAELLAKILNEKYGVSVDLITYVGPVIGAHSGPGTLALFFVTDKER